MSNASRMSSDQGEKTSSLRFMPAGDTPRCRRPALGDPPPPPPHNPPPSPAPPPSAGAGAASSRTPDSSAASASTTAVTLPSSAASSRIIATSTSNLSWRPPIGSHETASPSQSPPEYWFLPLGCRHGLALILSSGNQLLVWDPVTGDQHHLDIPPGFDTEINPISAAVLRDAGDIHHFQVVLVGSCERQETRAVASVYSSETGVWGNLISTQIPYDDCCQFPTVVYQGMPAVMVADSLYWLLTGYSEDILEFDLARRSLALIPVPFQDFAATRNGGTSVMLAEGGGLGFLYLTDFGAQSWKIMTDCDGVRSCVLQRSIELDRLLSLNLKTESYCPTIVGFAEDTNMVLLRTSIGIFSVRLESLQFNKLFESDIFFRFYPFEGVYTADKGIEGGHDGAELLRNT